MVIKRTCYWRWLFTNIVLLVVTVLPLFYRSSVCLHLPTLWITFSANPYALYKRIKRDIEKKNIKWNNLLKKPQLRWFETLWSLEYHSRLVEGIRLKFDMDSLEVGFRLLPRQQGYIEKAYFFLIWWVVCNIWLNSLPPRHWTLYDQSFFRFVIYAWGVVKLVISENSICHKCCIIGQSFMLGFLLAKYSSHCLSYSHQS